MNLKIATAVLEPSRENEESRSRKSTETQGAACRDLPTKIASPFGSYTTRLLMASALARSTRRLSHKHT